MTNEEIKQLYLEFKQAEKELREYGNIRDEHCLDRYLAGLENGIAGKRKVDKEFTEAYGSRAKLREKGRHLRARYNDLKARYNEAVPAELRER